MTTVMKSLFVLALMCWAAVSQAQTTANLTLADSGIAQLAPRIEHRDGRAYLAYIKAAVGSNGDIMLATRAPGEQTFSMPAAVTSTGKINATLQRGPEFAVAPDGTIHMVWMEQRFKANPDIFYSRGTENGTKWTEAEDISRDAQIATQDFPSIAVDSAGNVYVAWIDNREIVEGMSTNDHLYLTRSFDGGMTWDTPKRAERNPGALGGTCECCRTAMAASADGDLYIAYRTNMDNLRDIFVARSNNKGDTFDESIRVQTKEWMIHACPATGPMVALDARENLHVVYRSAANANKAAIFYNLLPKGMSRTFTEIPMTTASGSSANYADIAVTPNGAMSLVYQQSGLIYERISTDGGNSWSSATETDSLDVMQAFPIVGYDPAVGMLSTLWQDDRRDKNDIVAIERPFIPNTTLPMLLFFDRMPMSSDSLRLSWGVPGDAPATWFEIKTDDSTLISFGRSLVLARELLDHSELAITPKTAIGDGQSMRLPALSVTQSFSGNTFALSKHPVVAGERVSISVLSAQDVKWTIYDIQGREQGSMVSSPVSDQHELLIPSLVPGVYHLRSEELALSIKLVVTAR